MTKKKTIEEIKPAIESVYGYKLLSDEYINSDSKLEILCPVNHIFLMRWDHFKQGHRCPKCAFILNALNQALSFDTVKSKIEAVKYYELLSDEYINAHTKLKIKHSCGNSFWMSWNTFSQGQRCPECRYINITGENHYNWNPNLTDEHREHGRALQNIELYKWRKFVFDRDDYTCQCCGYSVSGTLEAHHIDSWAEFKDERFNTDNGVTLCETCHKACHSYHKRRHYPLATYKLFYEWMAKYSVINPENWSWVIRYPDAMNKRLIFFFKRAS